MLGFGKFGFGRKRQEAAAPETVQPTGPETITPVPEAVDSGTSAPVAQPTSAPPLAVEQARAADPPVLVLDERAQTAPESAPRAERRGWLRSRRPQPAPPPSPPPVKPTQVHSPQPAPRPEAPAPKKPGVFSRLRERLSRTRGQLGDGIVTLFAGRKRIDDDLLEELETLLLTADVGVTATTRIMADLTQRVKRKSLADPQALLQALKAELREILVAADAPVRQPAPGRPQVILMVGVNGAGKTTTIGKLAKRLQEDGNSVMLAAGDTFRAAAVEQLQTWGERNQVPVVAQQSGADSASVIFDALQAATARGADVLIADTAGRLHTKSNLMDELAKVARVLKKIDPDAPHEVMLVVDATTGQNALNQAQHFHQAVGLTGITLTKLDGTAKGGILFAIADRLRVPIRFIGVGETIDDLRPFDPDEFLDALLS